MAAAANDVFTVGAGQEPPWSRQSEIDVLGHVMSTPSLFEAVGDLKHSDFYSEAHRLIWQSVLEVRADGYEPTLAAVVLVLRGKKRKAAFTIAEELPAAAQCLPFPKPVREAADRIRETSKARSVLFAVRKVEAKLVTGDIGGAVNDLQEIAKSATTGQAARIQTIGPADIFAPLPEFPFIIPGLSIGPGRPTMIAGYANVGKTVIAQSMALSVCTGRPVFGVYSVKRGRVLHLDGEIGQYLARSRYQRLTRAMLISPDEIGDALRMANYPAVRLDDADAERVLIEACTGFSLVIVDSLTAFSGAIEENSKEIGVALYMLARVSEATGATFLVLHHCRKPQKDAPGGAKMAIRGSSSIPGGCEAIFVMTAEKGEPAKVEHERSPLGSLLNDFGLAIEDVTIDGNARGGLLVRHLEPEQMAVDTSHTADLERMRDVLRKHPGIPGREALAASFGRNRTLAYQLMRELAERGDLREEKDGRKRALFLVESGEDR